MPAAPLVRWAVVTASLVGVALPVCVATGPAGRVPGRSPAQRAAAERALLGMRARLRPDGAMAAGWAPGWMYSWPRDSSFAAAAFAHSGHESEAYRILVHSAPRTSPSS